MRLMRFHMTGLAALLAVGLAPPAEAQGNWQPGDFGSLRVRIGLFEPDAESEYWDDAFTDFSGSPSSFEDLSWGVDYIWRSSRSAGFMFGTSFFTGDATQAYLDYVDADGFDIRHLTSLDTWDLTAAWVLRLGHGDIAPYLGLGGGMLYWRLEETGDFIDFGDPDLPIVFAAYRAEGWTWEGFGLVGIDVRFERSWSFFAEARYRTADDDLGDDFAGLGTIDLSGTEISAGFSWNF